MPDLQKVLKRSFWSRLFDVSLPVRLTAYFIAMIAFMSLVFVHYFFIKITNIFVFSLLPLLLTAMFFELRALLATILFLFVFYLTAEFVIESGTPFLNFFPYLFIFLLYSFTALLLNKGVRLYKAYNEERVHIKETEDQLEQGKKLLRMTLLSIGDGVIMVDETKKITFLNFEAEKLTGWSQAEAQSRDVTEVYKIINEDTGRSVDDPVGRIQERGYAIGLANHTLLISKTGREIAVGDSGLPIMDGMGTILGYIIIFRDMSQKIAIQKQLKEAQVQAIQSEKLASIGQMAAGIAHEINNPLGYINNNLDILGQYITNLKAIIAVYRDTQYQNIQKKDAIQQAEKRLKINAILEDVDAVLGDNKVGIGKITTIVKNLKDFARINSQGEWEVVSLNTVIENVLVIINNEVKYLANIEMQLDKSIPPVYCHKSEVSQVILNILLNAVHALKKKFKNEKGKIQISSGFQEDHVICKISDNGCGIPDAIITRIFEPFFTTKAPGEGTGLGLHIAYDIIINKHKGDILVKSREGEGTSFTLKLPAHKEEQQV